MEDGEHGTVTAALTGAAQVPTPYPEKKNVFNRLYKGSRTVHRSLKGEGEKMPTSKTMPVKGRQVPSKFSGPVVTRTTKKYESCLAKRFSLKTPATKVSGVSIVRGGGTKVLEKTSPSVRLAKKKLESSRYWLSLISVAEKAENHAISMGLFRLAIECSAEPAAEIRKGLAAYKARYKLDQLIVVDAEPEVLVSHEDKTFESSVSEALVMDTRSDSQQAAIKSVDDAGGDHDTTEMPLDEGTNNEIFKEAETVKNLFQEEYSHIPAGNGIDKEVPVEESEVENRNHAVEDEVTSEIINTTREDDNDVTSNPGNNVHKEKTPRKPLELVPRCTPKRASAIRAAQKIEESAKKQSRRKQIERKTPNKAGATPAKRSDLEIEKMDVNTLMKEVVSCMLTNSDNGGGHEGESASKPCLRSSCKTRKESASTK